MSQEFLKEVDRLVRARYAVIYVVTWEEERARQLLRQIASHQNKSFAEWSVTDGLRKMEQPRPAQKATTPPREPLLVLNEILQAEGEAIYVLKDFHHFLDEPEVQRQLRDLSQILRRTRKTVVLISPQFHLPPDLEKSVTIVDLPLPTYDEIKILLTEKLGGGNRSFQVNLREHELDAMVKAAQGLTFNEAENAFAKAIVDDGKLDADDIELVAAEKKQIIRKTEVLEYCDVHESLAGVGGMDLLKDWLQKRVRAFSEDARAYGLPHPKGILLLGVQGCGKSLVAKSIAAAWRMPLLRLDMSRIFQSYIGSSEQNMRRAMTIAQSVAPVVLWVDEIEKAFSGTRSAGHTDGGTSARVLGSFLTWLQEKTAPVFIIATANEVQDLPPELLRKGRLDETFFVDLPNELERREIFAIHLAKARRDPAQFDVAALARAADGFSGSEIAEAVVAAMHDSFFESREVTTADLQRSIGDTVPLSQTMREKISELREWSRDRARPVSSGQLRVVRGKPAEA